MSGEPGRRWGLLLCLLLAGSWAVPSAAADPPRVVAIGDIHGEIEGLSRILRRTGLLGEDGSWVGGEAVLVQTGDVTDRGAGVRRVLDLLRRLQREAEAAGGRVEVLLGNHEAMNLVLEDRDVGAAAWAEFVERTSERRRRAAWLEWRDYQRSRATRLGQPEPELGGDARQAFLERYPPGRLEYIEAFGPDGEYGGWLRERRVAVTVGGTLFVHGGLSGAYVDADLESLDRTAHAEVARFDGFRCFLLDEGLILPFFNRREIFLAVDQVLQAAAADLGEGLSDAVRDRLGTIRASLLSMGEEWLLFRSDGPLWYRGYSSASAEELDPILDSLFSRLGVHRVVTAHTPSRDGRVQSRLGGRVLLVDTGMLSTVYRGGRASALEIAGNRLTAIYETEQVEVVAPPMESSPTAADDSRTPSPASALVDSVAVEPRRLLAPDGSELPFQDDDSVLEFLGQAEVLESEVLGEGITRPRRLLLERDGVRARAIFHSVDVEKPTSRSGTHRRLVGFWDSYRNQVAAYRLARHLGLDLVPPAVVREVRGQKGSVALWIENARNERERLEESLDPPDPLRWRRVFTDMRVFDNLIYNIDRNQGNILVDSTWRLWLVDHTRSFGEITDLPFPEHLGQCSRTLWSALRELDRPSLDELLGDLLAGREIAALLGRRDRLVERFSALIDSGGERRVLFTYGSPDESAVVQTVAEP